MEIILGGAVAIGIGLLVVHLALSKAFELNSELTIFKESSTPRKGGWSKANATVIELGFNLDFPGVIFSWPQPDQFENEDEYHEALRKAQEEINRSSIDREAFGGVLIRYSYKTEAGEEYISRTIGRLPDRDRDHKLLLSLKKGDNLNIFYCKDEPDVSCIRKTDDERFKEYLQQLIKPCLGQAFGGVLLIILGVSGIAFGI